MTPSTLGKYELIEELGRGAMGVVYKARDPLIGREVALKTIRADFIGGSQTEAQERFLREARSAGNLSHPNIVTIYEVGEDQGLVFIAMQYIEGSNLAELLASGTRFAFEDVIRLMLPLAEALDYAHQSGIVHRDVQRQLFLITATTLLAR